jgi:23S rRNA-/tRNA-specific pseudouridylate synthase
MIRLYCDGCGKEITANENRVIPENRYRPVKDLRYVDSTGRTHQSRVQLEVLVAVNGDWCNGHICRECVVQVFNSPSRSAGKYENNAIRVAAAVQELRCDVEGSTEDEA